jgi:UDP-N-acetylmuramyl tripeptide synthase
VQIFLSKNPTSFNESLRTIKKLGAKNVLFVLNDRIPDGRDVSWIWDVDFEDYIDQLESIIISGERCYDMALRIKYAQKSEIRNPKFEIEPNLRNSVNLSLKKTSGSETLYILPTYSAMLEVRKILTGKKIL